MGLYRDNAKNGNYYLLQPWRLLFRFWDLGLRVRLQGLGLRILGLQGLGSRFRVLDFGFGAWGPGQRASETQFPPASCRVWGNSFTIKKLQYLPLALRKIMVPKKRGWGASLMINKSMGL